MFRDEVLGVHPQAQNPSHQSVDASSLDGGAPTDANSGPATKRLAEVVCLCAASTAHVQPNFLKE